MARNQRGRVHYGRWLAGCGAAAIVCTFAVRGIRGRDDRQLQDGRRDDRTGHRPDVPIFTGARSRPDRRAGVPGVGSLVAQLVRSAAVVGVVCSFVLASWWDPSSWWGSISGDLSAASSAAKGLIRSAVDAAIRQVESVIDSGFDAVYQTFDAIRGAVDAARHDAAAWVDDLRSDAAAWVDDLRSDAASWVDGLRHDAATWLDDLRHDAASWVDRLRHDAAAALDAVVRDLVDPLIRWVDAVEHWWQAHIAHWWDEIYHSVIAPIIHDLKIAYDWADEVYHWYVKIARDEIALLIKAADWIEWFAKHPFSAIEDAGKDLAHSFNLKTIENLVGDAERDVDNWAEDVARWIA